MGRGVFFVVVYSIRRGDAVTPRREDEKTKNKEQSIFSSRVGATSVALVSNGSRD